MTRGAGTATTVLLDVNGTLVPSGASSLDVASLAGVVDVIARLRTRFSIGLCSDSPLPGLSSLGHTLGLDPGCPLLAENGNVVRIDGRTRVRVPFPWLADVRAVITDAAGDGRRWPDRVSPEFGAAPVPSGGWAFGAGRRASVSVLGDADIVERAGSAVLAWARPRARPVSTDVAPQHRFLGVHPRPSGKAGALVELAGDDRDVVMVGNSESDWVRPGAGVRCGFVADAGIRDVVRDAAWAVARSSGPDGVAELLLRLAGERETV